MAFAVNVMDDVDGDDGFASAGRGGCAEASAVSVMDDGVGGVDGSDG